MWRWQRQSWRIDGGSLRLDTNVFVRYTMQYDTRQSPKASRLIESSTVEAPGFVSVASIVELGRVLSSAYGLNRTQVGQAFEVLLRTKEVVIDRADRVECHT